MLNSQALWHGVLVEGEGDIGTVALRVALCVGRETVGGRPALALTGAWLDETALVPDGHTRLTNWALATAVTFTVDPAEFGTAPDLCTGDLPIVALAGVAIVIPFGPVHSHQSVDNTGSPSNFLASGAGPPWWTQAAVAVDLVYAGGAERAGRRLALVDVNPAVWSGESRGTLTPVPVISIHTGSTVIARVGIAVVGILVAGQALPALFADAGERVSTDYTGASVLTRARQTAAVLSYITGGTLPSGGTHAFEGVPFIVARSAIVARSLVTLALP